MASKVVNRAKMSVTGTPGTGAFTLNAAVTNFQTFAAAGVSNGDQVGYLAEGAAGVEIGTGSYASSGTSLTRTVIFSTNANAAVSFASDVTVTATALAQDIARPLDRQVFTASGTWTKPKGFSSNAMALIEVWGGGGSGAKAGGSGSCGGGGGGAYAKRWILLSLLGATETVTIGAGGAARSTSADGAVGGTSSFGSWNTAYGGGGGSFPGSSGGSGGGGGPDSAGSLITPGNPLVGAYYDNVTFFQIGQGVSPSSGNSPVSGYTNHGGGGGYSSTTPNGASALNGGGGGGGSGTGSGGISQNGGNGGAGGSTGTAGTAPAGGGGSGGTGPSGAGARGEVRVTVFDGA